MTRRYGYARNTEVTSDRTISQLRALLERFGADTFAFATNQSKGMVSFCYEGRTVRFTLDLPRIDEDEFALTPTGKERAPDACRKEWEQACRSKWRSLFLLVKALLVAIEDGLIDFDRAFMHDIVTPDGRTVGERLLPDVQAMIEQKKDTPLLLPLHD